MSNPDMKMRRQLAASDQLKKLLILNMSYNLPDEKYLLWLRETHPDTDFSLYNVFSLADYFS